jgi:hypothetical protein
MGAAEQLHVKPRIECGVEDIHMNASWRGEITQTTHGVERKARGNDPDIASIFRDLATNLKR